jgi:TonB family protein
MFMHVDGYLFALYYLEMISTRRIISANWACQVVARFSTTVILRGAKDLSNLTDPQDCMGPSRQKAPLRMTRFQAVAWAILIPASLLGSTNAPGPISPTQISATQISPGMQQREMRLSRPLARSTQFAEIQHVSGVQDCEQVEAPVALATPDPLFLSAGRTQRVRVSFIIGTDGRVHSPLILESAGLRGDRRVLDTVRTWRYRPGTCNGVPTETEGKIEFSVH